MTQTDKLLAHFKLKKSISNVEAQALYRIRSLSRRICDLKDKGFTFNKEHKTDPTGQRYVRYYLVS